MNRTQAEAVNIGLMLVSLILAIFLPFEVFLLAYAVLGPLHYLTEINWLDEKKFFLPEKRFALILAAVAAIVVLPKLFLHTGVQSQLVSWLNEFSNVILFLALSVAIALLSSSKNKVRLIVLFGLLAIAVLSMQQPWFLLIIGALLPTLIHVYLFTGLFMLSGVIRSRSYLGGLGVLLFALVPVIVWLFPVDPEIYTFSDLTKNAFVTNGFAQLIMELRSWMGISGSKFLFYDPLIIKLQIFIAFAYLYHYLNWFSKTAIIGWGKALKGIRFYTVFGLWLILLVAYWIDFRIGFMSSLFFSFLHVTLEFPLNVASVKTIMQVPTKLFK